MERRISTWKVVPLTLALMAGCASPTAAPEHSAEGFLPGPREVTLRLGDEIHLAGSALRLAFAGVEEDSRCPVDVTCVWEGNGRVTVGLTAGSGPTHALELNTSLDPRSAVSNGVRVTLLELQPLPRAGEPIPEEDYTIRLRVEPTG